MARAKSDNTRTAPRITYNGQTALMVAACLASATIAGALAIAAAPSTVDPIRAAIAAHREAARTVDIAYAELLQAEDIDLADKGPMQDALNAEYPAAEAMIGTAPTTRSGFTGSGRSSR
jgi:hypothetical protein